jgi:hypothetical protein
VLGFLVGAVLYGLTYEQVFPVISKIANYGSTTMPDLWNLNPFLAVLLFALMALLLFYLIDRAGLHRNAKES